MVPPYSSGQPQPAGRCRVASLSAAILSAVIVATVMFLLAVLLVLGGCRRDDSPRPSSNAPERPSTKIRNVLLVSLDTLRADYLGCYGYDGEISPVIDALAAEGVLFENVVTPVPMTLPAHCSLLTGTNPLRHGVRQNIKYRLGPSHVTLAEILQQQGLATGAYVASHVLDRKFGVGQGFETFDDQFEGMERSAPQISRLANAWIAEHAAAPFFLWLHYFDPHAPFSPPKPYAEQFQDAPHGRYAGEIAYLDASLESVFGQLRDMDLWDSTLVVVVGDHGEALGDHGEQFHSFFVYQSTLRTPLIIKTPGVKAAKRISWPVSSIDVVPTVCGLLGLTPPAGVEGQDLSPYYLGDPQPAPSRALYFESLTPTVYGCNPLSGLVSGSWKLIQTTRPELYDLSQDPQESNNLANAHPDRLQELEGELQAMVEKNSRTVADGENIAQVDQQTIRQLESLGYVAGTVDEEFRLDQTKADPKDLIEYHRNYMQVGELMRRQRYDAAQQICLAMIKQQPDVYCGYSSLADIAMIAQKFPAVIQLSTKALALNEDDVDSRFRLAVALHRTGELAKATTHYRTTLELSPDKVDAHLNLGMVLHQEGNLLEAVKHYREALRLSPNNPAARQQLSLAQQQLGL